MARNRKRAKERRVRRRAGAAVAAANGGRDGAPDPLEHASPDPIEHAAPDAELAQAQLAVGRPEPEPEPLDVVPGAPGEPEMGGGEADWELDPGEPEGVQAGPERLPAPRPQPAARLTHFLQGSWRELQRVQWPDRRQVMQATGVVIGFVVVAGAFLGVADFVAGKLINLILK